MDIKKITKINELLEALGGVEEPFGMMYSNALPDNSIRPKPGYLPTRKEEDAGNVDFSKLSQGSFSCVIRHIRSARRKKGTAVLNKENFGCLGVAFYAGFQPEQLNMVERFVSTGTPGYKEGELYLKSTETCRKLFRQTNPRPAPADYCVFKPLSQFRDFDEPAGCSGITTWPINYYDQGQLKAVLGGWDPSARKYLNYDEIIFSVHRELFKLMLDRWPDSFLKQHAWHTVKKRIKRTNKLWGKG